MRTPQPLKAILILTMFLSAPALQAESPSDTDVAELSRGYALLYQTVKKVTTLDKVLYLKFESDPVDAIDTQLAEHASAALKQLEQYADSHPGIDLEDTGLPQVEQQRRSNTTKALLKDMATRSGVEFERLFLLALTNVVNQSRHTAAALADMPQDDSGKQLMQRLAERFDADYEQLGKLMISNYFRAAEE